MRVVGVCVSCVIFWNARERREKGHAFGRREGTVVHVLVRSFFFLALCVKKGKGKWERRKYGGRRIGRGERTTGPKAQGEKRDAFAALHGKNTKKDTNES